MNTGRFYRLIENMEEVKKQHKNFDMNTYTKLGTSMCNTAFCAFGWAAVDPRSIAEGLVLEAHWKGDGYGDRDFVVLNTPEKWEALYKKISIDDSEVAALPTYVGRSALKAAMAYYDISLADAEFLFLPRKYPTKSITADDVIGRVRELLAEYELLSSD